MSPSGGRGGNRIKRRRSQKKEEVGKDLKSIATFRREKKLGEKQPFGREQWGGRNHKVGERDNKRGMEKFETYLQELGKG